MLLRNGNCIVVTIEDLCNIQSRLCHMWHEERFTLTENFSRLNEISEVFHAYVIANICCLWKNEDSLLFGRGKLAYSMKFDFIVCAWNGSNLIVWLSIHTFILK